jgi:hypothetical protein
MKEPVKHQPLRHLFYFALMEKLEQHGWVASGIFLDSYDFFVPARRGSQLTVVERETHAEALPTHALIALPAISPGSVSSRRDREDEITFINQENYPRSKEPLFRLYQDKAWEADSRLPV